MLTPKQIQDLADPIEEIYMHMVDELLVNIGKHITSPTWTHTASWEIQKLAELGQLTQENAAIINAWIKRMPDSVRQTMEETRAAALDRLEKQLEQAAQDGYIQQPVTDTSVQVLRDALQQAEDRFNLVNTTMLESSAEQYARAVQLTEQEYQRLEAQRLASNDILNEAALSIASGAETRQAAVNRAIKRISDEGLTGFIDRAGRSWTPEAYVNMVTRTTVHNVAIESTKARMQDYNTQVFQVSSHAAARPGCYPYQGKYYSWDNTAGDVPLGNGAVVRYEPLNSTTYGQPAGLFGINCGHFPIPVIPGVTIPHGADLIQPKEENDREYAESQEQRELERRIREAKRVVEMAGDTATKAEKDRVRELQKQMREFTTRTGRARRYDRESLYGATPSKQKPTPVDISSRYQAQAKPGEGAVNIQRGYNSSTHDNELRAASWLRDTFGGDIEVLTEKNKDGVKTADFRWKGKLWELKNPTTEKATDQAVRKATKQIAGNPGGIILDYGAADVSEENVLRIITGRMRTSKSRTVDVIVKIGDQYRVIRYSRK